MATVITIIESGTNTCLTGRTGEDKISLSLSFNWFKSFRRMKELAIASTNGDESALFSGSPYFPEEKSNLKK